MIFSESQLKDDSKSIELKKYDISKLNYNIKLPSGKIIQEKNGVNS